VRQQWQSGGARPEQLDRGARDCGGRRRGRTCVGYGFRAVPSCRLSLTKIAMKETSVLSEAGENGTSPLLTLQNGPGGFLKVLYTRRR
jgi:hypothetical protein